MARIGAHSEPKEWSGEIKHPKIGHDYAALFRMAPEKDEHCYYMGGINFRVVTPKGEKTADSQKMYDAVIDAINVPAISMGTI